MSELIPNDLKMKPVVIVQKGTMSQPDLKRLRDNGICVVESKNPQMIRYMEPAPQGYTIQEWAAIELARVLLREGKVGGYNLRSAIGLMYADILLQSDPLKRIPPAEKL